MIAVTVDTVGALVAGPAPQNNPEKFPVFVQGGTFSGSCIGHAYAKAIPIRGKKVAGFHESASWIYTADQLRALADLPDLVDAGGPGAVSTVEGVPIA